MMLRADCIIKLEGTKEEWMQSFKRIGTGTAELAAVLQSKNGEEQVSVIVQVHNAEGASRNLLGMEE